MVFNVFLIKKNRSTLFVSKTYFLIISIYVVYFLFRIPFNETYLLNNFFNFDKFWFYLIIVLLILLSYVVLVIFYYKNNTRESNANLLVILLMAIFEEILFRLILFVKTENIFLNILNLIMQSLTFGFLHFKNKNFKTVVEKIMFSILMFGIIMWTNNIIFTIVFHLSFNFIAFFINLFLKKIRSKKERRLND